MLVADEIVLRFHVVGLGFLQLGFGGFELLFRDLNSGACAVYVSFGGGNLAGGIDGGNRNIHSGGDRCGLGIFKVRFGAIVGDLIVGRIDLDQHRSRSYILIVLHVELGDVAGDAGADGVHVAVDLSIVSGFVAGEIAVSEKAHDQQNAMTAIPTRCGNRHSGCAKAACGNPASVEGKALVLPAGVSTAAFSAFAGGLCVRSCLA